nr:NS1 [Chaphamaparvovirus sp.]
MGTTGTTRDLTLEQAEAVLVCQAFTYDTEQEMTKQCQLLNMKSFQCGIILLSTANGDPYMAPLPYALLFNELTTVTTWCCTAETNKDGVFHVHAMFQTTARTDSMRRSIGSAHERLRNAEQFKEAFGDLASIDVLKLERCHKPESMLAYMMKHPGWICSNSLRLIHTMNSLDQYGRTDRFRPSTEEVVETVEMNPMTSEIVDAIIQTGSKCLEDLMRHAPQVLSKYLHRPGLSQIITNCLIYVKATSATWSISSFAKFDIWPGTIHRVLLFQGIPPAEFDPIFHKWITKADSKKNTICISGPSNTGKSAFISGLKQCISWGEIVNSNTFAFEGLQEAVIGIWEEPLCSTELAEKAKQVLEGMQTAIPVKYRKPFMLPRTPIIITTNHPLWRFCTNEEDMFRNRMWIFEFNHQMKDQPYFPRTSEHSCECSHCATSRGSSSPHGESSPGRMPTANEPLSPGEQSIWTQPESEMGSGSLSDPGEGTSWSHYSTPGSSSTSTDVQRTDTARSSIRSCTTAEYHMGHLLGPIDSGNRDDRTKSRAGEHVESDDHTRSHGHVSRGNGNRGGRGRAKLRRRGTITADIRQYGHVSTLVGMGHTPKTQSQISIPTKKRKLDRPMDPTVANPNKIPLYVPSKQDWQQYLSYLYHWYG